MTAPRRRATAAVRLPLAAAAVATLDLAGLLALHAWGMALRGDPAALPPPGLPLDPALPRAGLADLLQVKARLGREALRDCRLCERRCGIDRLAGQTDYCGVGAESFIGSEFIHMGEEPELVPSHAVFFAGCTFHCVYCQAHKVAFNPRAGFAPGTAELAALVAERQRQGARNVNFVGGTPEPHVATILALAAALPPEVDLPFVMNANMSMTPEAMDLLDGVIDLYLADFRHGNDDCARRLMGVEGYTGFITRNLLRAAADAGLLVRVLALPNHLDCCLRPILEWLAAHMPRVRLNVMFQYRPSFKAWEVPEIARRLSEDEMATALRWCAELGLENRVPVEA